MPPRIQFKHIKRADEIPPPVPVVAKSRESSHDPYWGDYENEFDGWGWYHYSVSNEVRDTEPEEYWREAVWRYMIAHGYNGSMYEFFCRDCRETMEPDRRAVRFSWYKWQEPRRMKLDRVLR